MNIRKITEQANQVSELNDINVTEATSMKQMGFKPWNHKTPSFRIGRLVGVSANQLTKMFGPPKKGSGDGKSTMEWGFSNPQGLVFTVYDYRNPPASKSAPHNWSVGGVNKAHAASVQRAFKMMGVPGKMIKEETDPFMVGQTVSEWRDAGMEDLVETDVPLDKKFIMKGGRFEVRKAIDGNGYTIYLVGRYGSGLHVVGKTTSLNKKDVLKAVEDANKKVFTKKEEVEVSEQFKAGDKVKVPHKGKMVSGKIVRYDGGGTDKARQHGGGYVVDVGEPASVTVPKEKVRKEEVEVTEAINIGTKAYEIQMDMFSKKDQYILYRLSYGQGSVRFADGRKGTAIGTFKSKADAMAAAKKDAGVKESVEVEGEDLQEGKIKFSRILQGVKDMQGPFTIVVMKPTGPGALMQKKVPGRDALPAHINHMLANDLKGKAWKAIAIEGSSGGVLNVLFPKDVTKAESVEEEADPQEREMIKKLLAKAIAKIKGGKQSTQKATLKKESPFKGLPSFKTPVSREGMEEETEVISESMAATISGVLAAALVGGFSFAALNFMFDNAFTPSNIKHEWKIFVRNWKDKVAGGKMAKDQGAAMAKQLRGLIGGLPKESQAYLSGIVTRMQNSLKPDKDGKVDKEAAGRFMRVAKEKIGAEREAWLDPDDDSIWILWKGTADSHARLIAAGFERIDHPLAPYRPLKTVRRESVEEGFAQPTQKELQKSIKWLEGLLKDPAKMKKSGLDLQDVKDNLRAAKDFLDFGKKHASKINKEEVEVDEAKEKFLTGPGKSNPRRLIGIYTTKGKWVKDMNSEREAAAFVSKSLGEEVEVDEASWGGGFQSSREAQAGVQASAKADAKRERTVLFSSIRAVMSGKMSKAEFKKKIGQSFDKISPLAKQKAMKVKEEVVDENTYTTAMGTKVTHIDYGQMAAEEAKKIKERAKQLGVQVLVQSSTSIAFVKSFTKGSMQEFFKAYRDCDRIRSMVKFKGNQNEWGCSTAGVGIGAQECVKSGKVMIYKSGSGAAGLLRKLEESLSDDEMLSRIDEAFGDLA